MAIISRDPFAREEIHRDVDRNSANRTCAWCGGTRPNGTLFSYRTETDGGRTFRHKGLFCSKSCHDAYHS
jgi:hypothetical protein